MRTARAVMSNIEDSGYFPKYPKIQNIFNRSRMGTTSRKDKGTLVIDSYAAPEFKLLEKVEWEVYEKIDGTNIRIKWDGKGYEVRGRTDNAQLPKGLLKEIDRVIDVDKFREVFGDNVVILYGEGYGANIQKVGKLYSESYKFILFDILIGQFWLTHDDILDIGRRLNIDVVRRLHDDVIGSVKINCMGVSRPYGIIGLCHQGFMSSIGSAPAEGVIIKPSLGLKNRRGKRIIAKVKCSDFW